MTISPALRPESASSSLISSELLSVLDAFSSQTSAIFDDLSRAQTRQAVPSQASQDTSSSALVRTLASLSDLDERLAVLLQNARVHERNQRVIETLEEELMRYELDWRAEMKMLERERRKLTELVQKGRRDRDVMREAEKGGQNSSQNVQDQHINW